MPQVAILIPCYNEAVTIGKVVDDFARELPQAAIYVYDNNSTDGTARIAREHGAIVKSEPRQGKGNVTRQMFRDVEADCYVMVDGDDTYPAEYVHQLIAPVLADEADMVVGDRLSEGAYDATQVRPFHSFGNSLVCSLINRLYGTNLSDVMSGYRAFNRVFVKSYPVASNGFEVETEMSIHCVDKSFRIASVPFPYRDRPAGSVSKLSTFSDGLLVLRTIATLFREYRPMRFFGTLCALFVIACLACGIPVLHEYAQTAYITHVPLAIAAVGCAIVAVLFFVCGLILDSVARTARKQYELNLYEVYGQTRKLQQQRADRSGN